MESSPRGPSPEWLRFLRSPPERGPEPPDASPSLRGRVGAAAAGVVATLQSAMDRGVSDPAELDKIAGESFLDSLTKLYQDVTLVDLAEATIIAIPGMLAGAVATALIMSLVTPSLGVAGATVVASLASAVVLGPVTEEYTRRLAARRMGARGYGAATAAINANELVYYVTQMVRNRVPVGVAVGVRLGVAAFHHVLASLQRQGVAKDLAGKVDRRSAGRAGLVLAILLHVLWNVLASILQFRMSSSKGEPQLMIETPPEDGAEVLVEQKLGSAVFNLASGKMEADIRELKAEAKDIRTPEQQIIVLGKIGKQLVAVVQIRHGQRGLLKFAHDNTGRLQTMLFGARQKGDPARELDVRLREAISDLSSLRDRVLALNLKGSEATIERLERAKDDLRKSLGKASAGAGDDDY